MPERSLRCLIIPVLLTTWICAVIALPCCADTKQVSVRQEALEIDAGQQWATSLAVPACEAEEAPVLALRARLHQASPGGCNYVLQVLLNQLPLVERPLQPRLLNKPPNFQPPGTGSRFAWYDHDQQGWMTIFAPTFEGNWAGTGQDYDYLFDLSGLVTAGQKLSIGFRYLNPEIPSALGVPRAPLVLDRVTVGAMSRAEVQRRRAEVLQGRQVRPIAVTTDLPAGVTPGERPYEIVWSGRQESPPAQISFEDLRGWTMEAVGDSPVGLASAMDYLLWRPRLARFDYGGGSTETAVEIRPPAPITISGRFDAANLWLYGGWDRVGDPPLRLAAALEDQTGREFIIDLGGVTAAYWGLQHGVLSPEAAAGAHFPMRFTALRISNCQTKSERRAYLESLAFYQQQRTPPIRAARPQPVIFPTSDQGMLPPSPPGATARTTRRGAGAEFTTQVRGKRLVFRVQPEEGCLHGVTARCGNGPRFRPMAEGNLELNWLTVGEGVGKSPATVVASSLAGERLTVCWRLARLPQPVEWQADYYLQGCTLVVDLRCAGGEATGLRVGQVAGLSDPRGIEVPYLLMGRKPGPWIACANGFFVSVLPDWYHSNCTSVNTEVIPPSGDRLGLLQGTVYKTLTNGCRNPLRERLLVSVSPEFADTLPSIRNPASPRREQLAPCMFFMADDLNPNLYRTLKRCGIDHLIGTDFAAILVGKNYAEGFAARWQPHPSLTMQQVQDYRRGIKELGFLFGTYNDFTDYYPGNALWDERKACLTPEGDFVDGWWGNYLCKPSLMPELVRTVGRQSRAAYPSDYVYLDVHTNRGLQAIDFEAGVAGAGIARDEIIANGDCLVEARKYYNSTVSEGFYRWLYAGLTDMDYASLVTTPNKPAADLAPLVDFDLLRIHPLQHGTMMGHHPDRFLSIEDQEQLYQDPGRGLGPDSFYKYVSASLAYGHMAMLGYWYVPPASRFIHYYALMQGVQSEYLTDNVAEIRYHNGTALVSTSQALVEGSQQLGRVYVRYLRGLTVYVNFNATTKWTVEMGGRTYELPPYGWVIEKPGSVLAYSALVDGKRVDFIRCPDYCYLNSASRVAEGPLEVAGAAWLKREGDSWRLIPCGDLGPWQRFPAEGLPSHFIDYRLGNPPSDRGCSHLAVDLHALLGKPVAAIQITAHNEAGETCTAKVHQVNATRIQFVLDPEALDYVIR